MSDRDIDTKEFNDLLKKMRKGDMEAYAKFYELYQNKIRGAAYVLLEKEHKSYTEDVLVGLVMKLQEGKDKGYIRHPGPWLYRAVKNYALDCVKKNSPERNTDAQKMEQLPTRKDELKEVEDRLDFYAMIRDLSAEERQIVTMKLLYQYQHKEIAKEMGLKLNTELSKFKRSLEKMIEVANAYGYFRETWQAAPRKKKSKRNPPEGDKPGGKEDPPT